MKSTKPVPKNQPPLKSYKERKKENSTSLTELFPSPPTEKHNLTSSKITRLI